MANYLTDNVSYGGLFLGGGAQPYNWTSVTPATRDLTSPWLTIEEIRDQLNLFGDTSQDTYLLDLDLAARWFIEDYLGQAIFPQSYDVYYAAQVLNAGLVVLDTPPTITTGVSVSSVSYYTDSDVPTLVALPTTAYYADPTGSKIVVNSPVPDNVNTKMTAPVVARISQAATYIADYPVVKHAGRLLITHWYNERSDVSDTAKVSIPFGFKALLSPYKPLVI